MIISFFGASQEVGRSGIGIQTKNRMLLMDYGIKMHGGMDDISYPMPFHGNLDAILLSHAHLDHSGYIPALFKIYDPDFYTTPPTTDLINLLYEDSIKICRIKGLPAYISKIGLKKMQKRTQTLSYNSEFTPMHGVKARFLDAGHISGSAMVSMNIEGKHVLYTGDYKSEDTLLHNGAKMVKDVDILITESTYSNRDHPNRQKLIKELKEETKRVIESGGTALFPSFAIGRSQELACLFSEMDCPVYLDGMAKSATDIMLKHSSYVANYDLFKDAISNVRMVNSNAQRNEALREPSIVITTAGMLDGGPVLSYIPALNKASEIFLTGYQVEGTNGNMLIRESKIDISGKKFNVSNPVHKYDLSAHAGRNELFEFIKIANPSKIYCVHGDMENCKQFADELSLEGFDAVAPSMGESFDI